MDMPCTHQTAALIHKLEKPVVRKFGPGIIDETLCWYKTVEGKRKVVWTLNTTDGTSLYMQIKGVEGNVRKEKIRMYEDLSGYFRWNGKIWRIDVRGAVK